MSNLPFLKNFISHLSKNNYSEETIYNYERDLEAFGNFLRERNINFQQVNIKVIEDYKDYLISSKRKTVKNQETMQILSSFSINRMLSGIKSYFKFLVDLGYKLSISTESIKLIRTKRKQFQNATLKDQIKLIESPTKFEKNKIIAIRNRAILETVFSTGIKISELINLRINDIDHKKRRIFVRKKGKKERFVYLTPRAKKYLNSYSKIRGNSDSPYLFIPYRGKNTPKKEKRISPNYLQDKIKKYRELLGINIPISAEYLRHAFATYLAESGANPAAIQILLGHESLDTTTRYVHASDRYAEKSHKKYHPLKE